MRNGRPAGVIIEPYSNPSGNVPNMSIKLSLAEVPPPYSGDFLQSTLTVVGGVGAGQVTGFTNSDVC